MKLLTLLVAMSFACQAADYGTSKTVLDGVEVVRLSDSSHRTEVSIATSIGNNAYAMKVNGKNILYSPFQSLSDFKAKPSLAGNPLLAPWANRLDQLAFYANGRKYLLNPDLKNITLLGRSGIPNHGIVAFSPHWKITNLGADSRSAWSTSRLEFWRFPDLMAQFPFAHTIEMTYRLASGVLEVETSLENLSTEPMPIAVGYHTYYQIDDAPRERWQVRIPARERLVLSQALLPTGESKAMELPDPLTLADPHLEILVNGLIRGKDGRAEFYVRGEKQQISVLYGPKYTAAVVYAPKGRNFICFEPMSAITNAFNLAESGLYKELQSVPAGGRWRESFWIRPSGF